MGRKVPLIILGPDRSFTDIIPSNDKSPESANCATKNFILSMTGLLSKVTMIVQFQLVNPVNTDVSVSCELNNIPLPISQFKFEF